MNKTSTFVFCATSSPLVLLTLLSCFWGQPISGRAVTEKAYRLSSTIDAACEPLKTEIETELASQIKTRDLARYDKAGPYCVDVYGRSKAGNVSALLRDFVWSHWRNHGRGFAVLASFSKEGVPQASFFFIEPDQSGTWRVSIKSVRLLNDRVEPNRVVREIIENDAYFLDRIEPPKNGLTRSVLVAEKDKRASEFYVLRLKNKTRKFITNL